MSGPCNFVVFGATGDLVTTKLLPSLYHLELAGRLDSPMGFIAFARRDWNTQRWRAHLEHVLAEQIEANPDAARRFVEAFYGAFLTQGQGLGESMRRAKMEAKAGRDRINWLAFTLFGDPGVTPAELFPGSGEKT